MDTSWGSLIFFFVLWECVSIGFYERNGMVVIGLVLLFSLVGVDQYSLEKGKWTLFRSDLAIGLLLSLGASSLHLEDGNKVWIVGNKTTLTNTFLFRMPFTPLATSVKKDQGIWNKSFTAWSKKGVLVKGVVFAEIRLTDDEKELLTHIGAMKDPDKEIKEALLEVIGKAFSDAIAKREVIESGFDLDVDVGTDSVVKHLGLRRNGLISVFGLRPQFIDK